MSIQPGNVAEEILATLFAGLPQKVLKFYKRKIKGLHFAVLGYRNTGKTTLIDRMRGKKTGFTNPPGPTPPGMHEIKKFEMALISTEGINVKQLYDVPGDEEAWERDWVPFLPRNGHGELSYLLITKIYQKTVQP